MDDTLPIDPQTIEPTELADSLAGAEASLGATTLEDLAQRLAVLEGKLTQAPALQSEQALQQAEAMAQPRLQQEYGDMASVALKVFLYDVGPSLQLTDNGLQIGDMTFEAGLEAWLKSADAIRLKAPTSVKGIGSSPEMLPPVPDNSLVNQFRQALLSNLS